MVEPHPDLGDIAGKVAVVTGGARGIGRAYAAGLARRGCKVVIADLVFPAETVAELRQEGLEAHAVQTDVSDSASVERMAIEAVRAYGQVDFLVNNAGYFRTARRGIPFDEIDDDEWERAFAVNVRGTWLACKAIVPLMKAEGRGRIVNVTSQVVWRGTPGFLHYVSAKAAVIGLTRAMARELGDYNIGVNAVAPDWIPHDLEYAATHPGIDERIVSTRAFKRTMVPDDMVGLVVFLVSPGSAFITGQTFLVNGGSVFQ